MNEKGTFGFAVKKKEIDFKIDKQFWIITKAKNMTDYWEKRREQEEFEKEQTKLKNFGRKKHENKSKKKNSS